eukprot:997862-Prorocentrum_lima.AAC.1
MQSSSAPPTFVVLLNHAQLAQWIAASSTPGVTSATPISPSAPLPWPQAWPLEASQPALLVPPGMPSLTEVPLPKQPNRAAPPPPPPKRQATWPS